MKDAKKFEIDCAIQGGLDGEVWCYNDVEVDWMPSGFQQVTVRRGCRNDNWKDECWEGESGGLMWKDCHNVCKGTSTSACNNEGTSSVENAMKLFGEENGLMCRECAATDPNDTEMLEYCRNVPSPDPNTGPKCPIWANVGCFNAKAITTTIANTEDYAYFKGCSTFRLNETECHTFQSGALVNGRSCRNTCDDLFCNEGPVQPPPQCYVCDYTWDDFGLIGQGDARCLDETTLTDDMIQNCGAENKYCITGKYMSYEAKILTEFSEFSDNSVIGLGTFFPDANRIDATTFILFKKKKIMQMV